MDAKHDDSNSSSMDHSVTTEKNSNPSTSSSKVMNTSTHATPDYSLGDKEIQIIGKEMPGANSTNEDLTEHS